MILKSIIFVIYVFSVDSETPEECSAVLNFSDCGLRPTMVYTHFGPMSMCHAAIWRGCPTNNKFVNEYQCMEYCMANNEVKIERCDVPLNTSRCTNQMKPVYTFSAYKRVCVKALWFGCPSDNMFNNMTACVNGCQMKWVDKLARMDISEVQEASKVLNELINKLNEPSNKRIISGKRGKVDDSSAKAYFIRKLQKVNRELEARTEPGYTNLMLMDVM